MKLKVTLVKNNGEEVEYTREIGLSDSTKIIAGVEEEVSQLKRDLSPLLMDTIIEEHQSGFEGEKIIHYDSWLLVTLNF